jgi:hypothetical protein
MMGRDYVSEPRPQTSLFFISHLICEHGPMVVMMPSGDNSWLAHQSSLAVLPTETSVANSRNWRRNENFGFQCVWYLKELLTYCEILRHGTSGFTSCAKEYVLRTVIVLRNPSPRPCLNPRPLGPVASTLATTPPRRLICVYIRRRGRVNLTAVNCHSYQVNIRHTGIANVTSTVKYCLLCLFYCFRVFKQTFFSVNERPFSNSVSDV